MRNHGSWLDYYLAMTAPERINQSNMIDLQFNFVKNIQLKFVTLFFQKNMYIIFILNLKESERLVQPKHSIGLNMNMRNKSSKSR